MNTNLLGWTMLHFLWLGTALLVVAAIVRLALRRAGANVRYAHSLATLLALATLPLGIAAWLSVSPPPSAGKMDSLVADSGATGSASALLMPATDTGIASGTQIIELNPDYNPGLAAEPEAHTASAGSGDPRTTEGATGSASALLVLPTNTGRASGTLERTLSYIESTVPYLPYLWLLGTPITFALLATGLIGAERMRRHGTFLTDGPVLEACERLRNSLRITRRVTLALCDRVAQPVLVGILRPLILLPPAALAGWSPAELEMVLLHELAHVRRWDNFVNLAQRVIESLLFFHPAVWIASTWVRRDREDCCDAVVVTRTEQPKQYAELLIALASPQPYAGLAMARHPLAGRLRRILKLEDEPMLVSRNTIGLLTLAVVAIALVVVSGPLRVQGEDKPADTDPPPSSAGDAVKESTSITAQDNKVVVSGPDGQLMAESVTLSTNPLAGVVYPSPRAEEIAQRAWKELHIKLVLPTEEELEGLRKQGYRGGLRLTEPTVANCTLLLTNIEESEVTNFDDLDSAINRVVKDKLETASWSGQAGRHRFHGKSAREGTVLPEGRRMKQNQIVSINFEPALVNETPSSEAVKPELDPLSGLTYPSPREGEIAMRAYQSLRLKLAPATPLESETGARHGKPSAIKIVSLSSGPLGTTLLTKIESIPIQTFDDVDTALKKFQLPIPGARVRWEAISENSGECLGLSSNGELSVGPKYADPGQSQPFTTIPVPVGTVPAAVPVYSRVNTPNGPVFQLNPLAGIAYPSPREGEIAQRAWKDLKIKVAPATEEELGPTRAPDSELQAGRGFSHRGGLKLIDFNENFPNLEGTPILKELQCSAISTHISGFVDLEKALDAIAAKKPDTIILNGMIGGNRFNYSMTYPVTQPAPVVSPSSKTIARVYDIPRDTLSTPAAVELENWINAQKIQVMDDSPPDNRVIITATEAQHERIAEFLTDKPDDRIVKSHDIPKELRDSVSKWAETVQSIQGVWDDRGKFIMQAARSKHDDLDRLVQGMEKWNDPEAAKERTKNPVVKREENGQPVLEWRSAGLTLAGGTRLEYAADRPRGVPGPVGVGVMAVTPGSPAAWLDIQPGDILTEVNGFRSENVSELASILESFLQGFENKKTLQLILYPAGRPKFPRAQSRHLPLRAELVKVTEAGEEAKRRDEFLRRMREQQEQQESTVGGRDENSDAGVVGKIEVTPAPSTTTASAEELEALRDYVKVIEEQYKLIDSLHRQGVKGGETNKRELAAYEMYVAQGELALAEGNREEAHLKFDAALNSAHNAFEAATEAYKQGIVSYDFLLQAIKNKAEIRRKIIHLKEGKQALAPGVMPGEAVNSNSGVPGRMVYESTADGTVVGRMVYPQPVPAVGAPLVPIPPTAIGPPTAYTPASPVTPPVATYAPSDPNLTPSQTLPPPSANAPTLNTAPPAMPTAPPTTPWSSDWPAPSTTPPTSNQPQPTKQPAPANLPSWPAPSTQSDPSAVVPSLSPPIPVESPRQSEGSLSFKFADEAPVNMPIPGEPMPPSAMAPTSAQPAPANLPEWPTPSENNTNSQRATRSSNIQAAIDAQNEAIREEYRRKHPVYKYDGKTFQTWRDTWKHELSTEKRIEAVKALAAFGRAGYAKEAAETILDVAGEYEFQMIDSNLRDAIVTAFAEQIKFTDWQPLLQERYDADPEKWESIATNIFRLSRPENDDQRIVKQQFLLNIAKHGTQAQLLAFQSLMSSGPGVADEEIKQLALDGLKSDDNTLGSWALMAFSKTGNYPPEYVDILLHGDQEKQRAARSWVRNSGEKALPLVEMLLEILKDNEQAADHLAAIRALGAIRASVVSAPADLRRIVRNEKEDLQLRVAAAVALDQIDPRKNEGRLLLLSGVVGAEQEERTELMMEEMRELKLPATF